jgi:hypothetical protein
MRSNSPFHSDFLDSAQGKENIPPDDIQTKKPKAYRHSHSGESDDDDVSIILCSHFHWIHFI